MIISASRRTDIPAFYSEWFMNRLREGWCAVPNPYNRKQVSIVPLAPELVDVIVFWTRNGEPLFQCLSELDRMGYHYYFQYTILGYPRKLDRKVPPLDTAISSLIRLSGRTGADRVIWRYDPIVLTNQTGIPFHLDNFERIACSLEGKVHHCTISLVDHYRKIQDRMNRLKDEGFAILPAPSDGQLEEMLAGIVERAQKHGITVSDCSENQDWNGLGIRQGKCIDDRYIKDVFGIEVTSRKDPGQRIACGCVISKDIGMYDSCLYGCQYCYATGSFERAKSNHAKHNPASPSLLGWYEVGES